MPLSSRPYLQSPGLHGLSRPYVSRVAPRSPWESPLRHSKPRNLGTPPRIDLDVALRKGAWPRIPSPCARNRMERALNLIENVEVDDE
jgi:hypothetical protein